MQHAMRDGWKVGPWARWTNSGSQIVYDGPHNRGRWLWVVRKAARDTTRWDPSLVSWRSRYARSARSALAIVPMYARLHVMGVPGEHVESAHVSGGGRAKTLSAVQSKVLLLTWYAA